MPSSILLIEDNSADVDLIRRMLEKVEAGIRISVARDGAEALETINKWGSESPAPKVILLDLKLPKVSGLEVLNYLKSSPKTKSIPVVVLTSSNELKDITEAYQLGANSYILKAIDFDQFSQAISLIHRYWCNLNINPE
jgi:CheY-like chemotaxis protein